VKILVVYGTRNGQTKRIAERIGARLHERGVMVDLVDARAIPIDLRIAEYDGVIAGASIIAGRFQTSVGDFISGFRAEIALVPSAFFGVSLAEADPRLRGQAAEQIGRFMVEYAWRPTLTASFAGALPPSRLRWLARYVLFRRLDKRREEFTDWTAVAEFADEFVAKAEARAAVAA
jgi:menaquinone-dependent protoporphyrinogen oxidase